MNFLVQLGPASLPGVLGRARISVGAKPVHTILNIDVTINNIMHCPSFNLNVFNYTGPDQMNFSMLLGTASLRGGLGDVRTSVG